MSLSLEHGTIVRFTNDKTEKATAPENYYRLLPKRPPKVYP